MTTTSFVHCYILYYAYGLHGKTCPFSKILTDLLQYLNLQNLIPTLIYGFLNYYLLQWMNSYNRVEPQLIVVFVQNHLKY